MTNQNRCTVSYKLHGPDVDTMGRWKPSAILRAMQESAGRHCEALNLDYERTLQAGLFWVVIRSAYRFNHIPLLNETIHVTTWSGRVNRILCPRHYIFTDETGRQVGVATSQWLLLDVHTRTATTVDRLPETLPCDNSEPPMPMPKHIRMIEPRIAYERRKVRFSECDTNRHLNNTHYADWFCDMLPERLETEVISELQINFKAELLCSQQVDLNLYGDQTLTLEGIREDGQTAFELEAVLTPWTSEPVITL